MRSILSRPRAIAVALALVPALAVPGARAIAPDTTAKPGATMEALMADIDQVERKLVALAEAIPEDAWGWRPAEGVRSVPEVLMHVAADNYFIPALAGHAAPEASGIRGDSYPSVQAFEGRTVSKEEALAELEASFRHLDAVMGAAEEATLGETVDLFGQESTRLRLWVMATTHLHEHLGQLIAYARSNGVAPPWSG